MFRNDVISSLTSPPIRIAEGESYNREGLTTKDAP